MREYRRKGGLMKIPFLYWLKKCYRVAIIYMLILNIALPCWAWTDSQIADAIYKAENSKHFPYGIKSVNTFGNENVARKICLNTIRNNRVRFARQNKYNDFIEFLGSRYCPTTIKSEYHLNKNWVSNVKYYLSKSK